MIALGGVIGSELRYLVGLLVAGTGFGWSTVVVNVTGGFGMGLLTAVLAGARRPRPLVRLFLATGVLGGFTTFSAFSADTVRLAADGRPWAAAGYVVLTLLLVLVVTYAGDRSGAFFLRARATVPSGTVSSGTVPSGYVPEGPAPGGPVPGGPVPGGPE